MRQNLDYAVYHKNSNNDFVSYNKEWNNAICSNMDEPRDCHIKWSKSDRDRYDITSLWNLKKMVQIDLFTKQK